MGTTRYRYDNSELWLVLLTNLAITAFYLLVVWRLGSIPRASEFFGHSLGIIGFLFMLMTETLYSLRKRTRSARWGRMSTWLKFHIYTGLVGPYMVLLHTSWKFSGLAGVVMLLTAIVVISGFIGRYIYTAVPRTPEGIEVTAEELERAFAAAEAELQRWLAQRPPSTQQIARRLVELSEIPAEERSPLLVLGRALLEWEYRWRMWREKRRMDKAARAQAKQLERLLARRRALRRQLASLAMARRLLGLWHTVHIPLGVALFTLAFIHIAAAIYYATLLR